MGLALLRGSKDVSMQKNRISSHDRFIKSVLCNTRIVGEFFTKNLPEAFLSVVALGMYMGPLQAKAAEVRVLSLARIIKGFRNKVQCMLFFKGCFIGLGLYLCSPVTASENTAERDLSSSITQYQLTHEAFQDRSAQEQACCIEQNDLTFSIANPTELMTLWTKVPSPISLKFQSIDFTDSNWRTVFNDLTLNSEIIHLSLWSCQVDDKFIACIVRLFPRLQSLGFEGSNGITDTGLANLRGLQNFEVLHLEDCRPITGEWGSSLAKLTKLRELYLSGTDFTDEMLTNFSELTSLRKLYLSDTSLTGLGLKFLNRLSLLELCLAGTDFTTGLEHLSKSTSLRELYLSGTNVTDTELAFLRGLDSLRVLDIEQCRGVTGIGLADIKVALPNVVVRWSTPKT